MAQRHPAPRARGRRLAVVACMLLAAACKRGGAGGPDAGADAASTATFEAGPMVSIPAGKLVAGSPCSATPRVTNEELPGEPISLNEFSIDVFPYPNDPAKPARVDVTRDEAAGLCAATGKRLCTELEWERACKGSQNTMFEYGSSFNMANCRPVADLSLDKRPKCVSAFGVKDLHGVVFEWTSSVWGRGQPGDLATVRGGQGSAVTLQTRCANGQGRAPSSKAKDIGFRCCAGPRNPVEVNLTPAKQPVLVEETTVEPTLAAAMMRMMPHDHRSIPHVEVTFDKLWRWHPRDGEELLIARWTARPTDDRPQGFELAVFKVCSGTPGIVARMRGPVAEIGTLAQGADVQKATAPVKSGDDKGEVKLSYWFGTVQIDQPSWIKVGAMLAAAGKPAAIKPKPVRKTR